MELIEQLREEIDFIIEGPVLRLHELADQLEAKLKQVQTERDILVLTLLEELLPECWDTPKAEQIIRDALKEIESDV